MKVKPLKIKIKEPTPSAADRLYAKHQAIRKAKGLPDPSEYKKKLDSMKTEEAELDEQHAEKGRFKPTMPHNVSNVSTAKTRASSDSANVKLKEAKDPREYDFEGDMVQSQLRSMIFNAEDLIEMMDENTNLPEWVQSKITLAEDYISTAANYLRGELTEAANPAQQAAIAINMKKKGIKPKNEEVEYLEEKNAPTNPALWSRAKALARSKFDVYPSAYANGWAAKWYKSKGGGWKTVSEETDEPSMAARTLSRKAQIVKNIAKNKKDENDEASDKFQKDPELASDIQKAP